MGASGLCGRDVSVEDAAVIRWLVRIPRTDGFARRMASVYAAFFCLAVFKCLICRRGSRRAGLDPRKIGIVPAAPMLIRIVAVPLAAAATLGAAGYAVMAFAGGFMAILAAYAAISVLSSPVRPLPDADGLRGLEVGGVA
jgi:PPP family 3-phenylpropionic acid transporter